MSLPALLDLSTAVDMVNHDILLQRLRICHRINDLALDWLKGYLTGRQVSALFRGESTLATLIKYGVPQVMPLPLRRLLIPITLFLSTVWATSAASSTAHHNRCQCYQRRFHEQAQEQKAASWHKKNDLLLNQVMLHLTVHTRTV